MNNGLPGAMLFGSGVLAGAVGWQAGAAIFALMLIEVAFRAWRAAR